nr:ImmA/IrrE family metallo-endopeptidase [Actinomycetota bacterium]
DSCSPANGRTDFAARTISVRADLSPAQAAKTLAHELAHAALHDGKAYMTACRGVVEVEAESVAYIVSTAAGLPTDGYSLPYVAHWSAGDTGLVRSTAERVISCARRIVADLGLAEPDVPAA